MNLMSEFPLLTVTHPLSPNMLTFLQLIRAHLVVGWLVDQDTDAHTAGRSVTWVARSHPCRTELANTW